MMELRSLQTARLAGRAASRWAASRSIPSTTTCSTSFSIRVPASRRHFSATLVSRQEADATAPNPASGSTPNSSPDTAGPVTSYMMSKLHQKPSEDSLSSRDIFRPSASESSQPDPSAPYRAPWANPGGKTAVTPGGRGGQSVLDRDMEDLGLTRFHNPSLEDFGMAKTRLDAERPMDKKYRLRPVVGRTVELKGDVDVARALIRLNMMCAQNKVRRDVQAQRFHERPGLKRKRLASERWRARFKVGFKAACSRVRVLAKQGW